MDRTQLPETGAGSRDGSGAGDNDQPYTFGRRPRAIAPWPFTERQYRRLVAVTRALLAHYPRLNLARITGHSDIAPGRKTDPGPRFDWVRYRAALAPETLA